MLIIVEGTVYAKSSFGIRVESKAHFYNDELDMILLLHSNGINLLILENTLFKSSSKP